VRISVLPSMWYPPEKGTRTILSKIYKQANRFNPVSMIGNRHKLPNLFDIIMNSIQTLQCELGNFKAGSADILINPDLSEYTWIEFYRPDEFINKGIASAEPAVQEINELLTEQMTL
jgi:predicted acylesterase/phospholipase RssA